MILLAILLPPLYFLTQKKSGMFILTSIMFVVSFFLAMMIVFIPVALILWAIAAVSAIRHNQRRMLDELLGNHARQVGNEVAVALQKQ